MSAALALTQMTCEDYFDYGFEAACNDLIQDMYWADSYSTDALFEAMQEHAVKARVVLTDVPFWDYDKFFHSVWKNTEKGLS